MDRVQLNVIARTLASLKGALEAGRISQLRDIGGAMGGDILLGGNDFLLPLAVLSYALAKCLEKRHISASARWREFRKYAAVKITVAANALQKGDEKKAHAILDELVEGVDELSRTLGRFEVGSAEKARVRIAADIYGHGASLATAAMLSGADRRFLQEYVSQTKMADKFAFDMPVKQRLKMAQELFK